MFQKLELFIEVKFTHVVHSNSAIQLQAEQSIAFGRNDTFEKEYVIIQNA